MNSGIKRLILALSNQKIFVQFSRQSSELLYQSIYYLLEVSKTSLYEELQLCSNIASLVGTLTLGSNLPIVKKDLDIKNVLLQATLTQKLKTVVPIICHLLLPLRTSQFFTIEIPYIQGLLDILMEIQRQPQAVQSYIQPIERLFMGLQIDTKKIQFEFGHLKKGLSKMLNSKTQNLFKIQTLPERVIFSEPLLRNIDPQLIPMAKQCLAIAIDLSINDIIKPVLDRSVSNTLETTREMVLKDFIYENNLEKIMGAAEKLISNLTWNLAMVTCREPLRIQIYQNLFGVFVQQNKIPGLDNKNAIDILASDNLQVACQVIQQAVITDALERLHKDHILLEVIKNRSLKGEPNSDHSDVKLWLDENLPQEISYQKNQP